MGGVAFVVYQGLDFLLSFITGSYSCNAIATLTSIILAAGAYFIALIRIGGYTEEMLLAFPKGNMIVKFAKKMHLV